MARYVIKACVTVDVELSIEAVSAAVARLTFDNLLAMSASLPGAETPYDVYDDSISEVDRVEIEVEA